MLLSPDCTRWQAYGRFYRIGRKGKRVLREAAAQFVLHQIAREKRGKEFTSKLVQAAHDMADAIDNNPATLGQALPSAEANVEFDAEARTTREVRRPGPQ